MAASKSSQKKIGLIIGSTRPNNIGPEVVERISKILKQQLEPLPNATDISFSLDIISIASHNLPVFDEPAVPQTVTDPKNYAHGHTRTWSATISSFDGYVLFTPSYNAGVSGGVKNAVDYLYHEWSGKPIMLIGYGIRGGIGAVIPMAETFANALNMNVVDTKPLLTFPGGVGPALFAAMGGALTDECWEEWKGQEGEILQGWQTLKKLLVEKTDIAT